MNTIGSHPGAIIFRLSVMIILIAILSGVFLSYVDNTEKELERASIAQTSKIIDSVLTVVFATYAVEARLDDLDELEGSNPFVFLEQYQMLPPGYQGEIDQEVSTNLKPGWYYLKHRKRLAYVSRYLATNFYYAVILNYEDVNQSGLFEPGIDRYQNLQFVKTKEPE